LANNRVLHHCFYGAYAGNDSGVQPGFFVAGTELGRSGSRNRNGGLRAVEIDEQAGRRKSKANVKSTTVHATTEATSVAQTSAPAVGAMAAVPLDTLASILAKLDRLTTAQMAMDNEQRNVRANS